MVRTENVIAVEWILGKRSSFYILNSHVLGKFLLEQLSIGQESFVSGVPYHTVIVDARLLGHKA